MPPFVEYHRRQIASWSKDYSVGNKLAFVLGGGGARGALQVGALRALFERGYQPDLLVGTSAGAINATFLALHGLSKTAVERLGAAWLRAAELDLLPSNYVWVTLRAMLRRSGLTSAGRIRDFFVQSGVTPDLHFGDLPGPSLIIVSSDLNTGRPVLYGAEPGDSVLDALLVSTALPPWVLPVNRQGQYLMDGAVVSGLPIEPALQCGATEIVALDLTDARDNSGQASGFGVFLNKLTYAVEQRHVDLELKLARARGVPVTYVNLTGADVVPIWDFRHADELIIRGYELIEQALKPDRSVEGA